MTGSSLTRELALTSTLFKAEAVHRSRNWTQTSGREGLLGTKAATLYECMCDCRGGGVRADQPLIGQMNRGSVLYIYIYICIYIYILFFFVCLFFL